MNQSINQSINQNRLYSAMCHQRIRGAVWFLDMKHLHL